MNRYAVSDLHGQLDLFNQIKEYINDDDIVYALGDFGDRGPEPWRTLQAVLDDKQFIYLMGNHDYMLINAIEEFNKEYNHIAAEFTMGMTDEEVKEEVLFHLQYKPRSKVELLNYNGGIPTLEQWMVLPKNLRDKYYWQLKTLPLEIRLGALDGEHYIYLTHAGYTPSHADVAPDKIEDFVWDRNHFYDRWDNSSGHLLIAGHTPIEYAKEKLKFPHRNCQLKEGCLFYDNNSKICIDRGAHFTNETVLLNIDTLEGHIFKTVGENNDEDEN